MITKSSNSLLDLDCVSISGSGAHENEMATSLEELRYVGRSKQR